VRVEVGDDYALVESLRYRPSKLLDFSYFASRPEEAELYGYKPGIQDANQVEIANRAYNGVTGNTQLGNGDIASGDGWKYRGRGLKQLTGRYNYTEFNKKYPELWPAENIDFGTNPEKLEEPTYAARSAVYFWLKNRLYEIADQGSENEKINSITAIINKHTDSYGERRNQFKRIWVDEKIFN
jgi:predicted chitinase